MILPSYYIEPALFLISQQPYEVDEVRACDWPKVLEVPLIMAEWECEPGLVGSLQSCTANTLVWSVE